MPNQSISIHRRNIEFTNAAIVNNERNVGLRAHLGIALGEVVDRFVPTDKVLDDADIQKLADLAFAATGPDDLFIVTDRREEYCGPEVVPTSQQNHYDTLR